MTVKTVYILDTEPMNANSDDLVYENTQDIPSWMHKEIKNGDMRLAAMEISKDYYRFNPGNFYSFSDAHKIIGSDKYLLITSFMDQQAQAKIKTLDELLKLDFPPVEVGSPRVAKELQDIEI